MKQNTINEFKKMVGEIISEITLKTDDNNYEQLIFKTESGKIFKMFHENDCCEIVYLEDVIGGRLTDLLGETVVDVDIKTNSVKNNKNTEEYEYYFYEYYFYEIKTNVNTITLRWYGESDYYSAYVDFEEITENSQN